MLPALAPSSPFGASSGTFPSSSPMTPRAGAPRTPVKRTPGGGDARQRFHDRCRARMREARGDAVAARRGAADAGQREEEEEWELMKRIMDEEAARMMREGEMSPDEAADWEMSLRIALDAERAGHPPGWDTDEAERYLTVEDEEFQTRIEEYERQWAGAAPQQGPADAEFPMDEAFEAGLEASSCPNCRTPGYQHGALCAACGAFAPG
ncbi:hypothetical protein DFJ74DRAFT_672019 [Hyaloraphidium curvatum]|nr:hypothetical protein DFJ74DRAFT_672019 [Hyaloraphidium curvatum]